MSEFERFNGFVRRELDDLLFQDFWGYYIFNESDLHSAAYYYIREFFRKKARDAIYVRCEPQVAGMRPDIVVYERGRPIYALEFKIFTKPDYINEDAVNTDIEKLDRVVQRFKSMRYGFFLLLYDADEPYSFTDGQLRRRGYEKISVVTVNARRAEGSGRRRRGYDEWRHEIEHLRELHSAHS